MGNRDKRRKRKKQKARGEEKMAEEAVRQQKLKEGEIKRCLLCKEYYEGELKAHEAVCAVKIQRENEASLRKLQAEKRAEVGL